MKDTRRLSDSFPLQTRFSFCSSQCSLLDVQLESIGVMSEHARFLLLRRVAAFNTSLRLD